LSLFSLYLAPHHRHLPSFPTRRSSDLARSGAEGGTPCWDAPSPPGWRRACVQRPSTWCSSSRARASLRPTSQSYGGGAAVTGSRSEEHTSELQSRSDLVCRLLLEKKKK